MRESDTQKAPFYQVTPGYFQTVRTRRFSAGGDFDERDRAGARAASHVVNETFARSIPKGRFGGWQPLPIDSLWRVDQCSGSKQPLPFVTGLVTGLVTAKTSGIEVVGVVESR